MSLTRGGLKSLEGGFRDRAALATRVNRNRFRPPRIARPMEPSTFALDMIRLTAWLMLTLGAGLISAAEKQFDFSSTRPGTLPDGWKSELAGSGKPGDWKVVEEEVPPALEPLSAQAPKLTRRSVLAQTAPSNEDERFPMLINTSERYGDFTFSTLFQITAGRF